MTGKPGLTIPPAGVPTMLLAAVYAGHVFWHISGVYHWCTLPAGFNPASVNLAEFLVHNFRKTVQQPHEMPRILLAQSPWRA